MSDVLDDDDEVDVGPELIRELLILESRKDSGVLEVHGGGGVATFVYFNAGDIVFAEASTLGETLPSWLIANGHLTREQYAEIVQAMTEELVDNEQVRFGEIAVLRGYVPGLIVAQGLGELVQNRLIDCLAIEVTERIFDPDPAALDGIPRFPIDLGPALRDGIEMHYDYDRLAPLIAKQVAATWQLVDPLEMGRPRFRWTREQMEVVRAFRTPTSPVTLLNGTSEEQLEKMRVLLLLWLSGLVESPRKRNLVTRTSATSTMIDGEAVQISRPSLPPMERPMGADLRAQTIPSMRPVAPEGTPKRASVPPKPPETERLNPDSRPPPSKARRPRSRAKRGGAALQALRRRQGPGGQNRAQELARSLARGAGPKRRPTPVQREAVPRSTEEREAEAAKLFRDAKADVYRGQVGPALPKLERALDLIEDEETRLYYTFCAYQQASGPKVVDLREELERLMTERLRASREHAFAHYIGARLRIVDEDLAGARKGLRIAYRLDEQLSDAQRWLRFVESRLGKKKK